MKPVKISDIEEWESEVGEDFIDQNESFLPITVIMGICFVLDYELFLLARPYYNKSSLRNISIFNDLIDDMREDRTIYLRVWNVLLHAINQDEIYNKDFWNSYNPQAI